MFPHHDIEGTLEDYILVSVPETTTEKAADEVQKLAFGAFKKPVIVITHNVAFLRAEKLSASDAAQVIKYAEDNIQASEDADSQAPLEVEEGVAEEETEVTEEVKVEAGVQQRPTERFNKETIQPLVESSGSDGSGSGDSEDGDSDLGAGDLEWKGASAALGLVPDETD